MVPILKEVDQVEPVRTMLTSQRGAALLFTIMVMIVVVTLGVAVLSMAQTEVRLGHLDYRQRAAFHAAQGGIEYAHSWLQQNPGSTGDLNGTSQDMAEATSFTLSVEEDNGRVTVRSTGVYRESQKTLVAEFERATGGGGSGSGFPDFPPEPDLEDESVTINGGVRDRDRYFVRAQQDITINGGVRDVGEMYIQSQTGNLRLNGGVRNVDKLVIEVDNGHEINVGIRDVKEVYIRSRNGSFNINNGVREVELLVIEAEGDVDINAGLEDSGNICIKSNGKVQISNGIESVSYLFIEAKNDIAIPAGADKVGLICAHSREGSGKFSLGLTAIGQMSVVAPQEVTMWGGVDVEELWIESSSVSPGGLDYQAGIPGWSDSYVHLEHWYPAR